MDIFIITTYAENKDNAKEYIEATKIYLNQNSRGNEKISILKELIYPVELKNEKEYKKFGLKELFNGIFKKYEGQKIEEKITERNINNIKSEFIKDFLSKEGVKIKLKALSLRVKSNFKLLAATLGKSPNVKGTTMLATSVIKIISNIYNHKITSDECLKIITDKGYTNELTNEDTWGRWFEKLFAVAYFNGPASKEVNFLADYLIGKYSEEIDNEEIYYKFLNDLKDEINKAIDSLKEVNDE